MKSLKVAAVVIVGQLITMQQAFATHSPLDCLPGLTCDPHTAIPEIDGSGAIIAIGLVAGLAALVREKYFRK